MSLLFDTILMYFFKSPYNSKKIVLSLGIILLLLIIHFPLFGHLEELPLCLWDESRLANNAYEMLHNHNWMVTYFNGDPDMWNTKPPLMIWLQVISMAIFGVNDLSVRLPSAIAGALTCLVVLYFVHKVLKRWVPAFIAVIILITSSGYVSEHVTRTGDYDALLVLFTTITCFSFYIFCQNNKYKWLYSFFIAFILATLTKGITVFMFLPAIFIYAITQKQVVALLKSKHFYIGTIIFIVLVFGYYFLREKYNPGYLKAVWENELGGRYFSVKERQGHEFGYYFNNMLEDKFLPWLYILPLGIGCGLFNKNIFIKNLSLFCVIVSATFFLFISISQTKLNWYDAPIYPFISILCSIFIMWVYDMLNSQSYYKRTLTYNIIPILSLLVIFINPYKNILDKSMNPKPPQWIGNFYDNEYYLKNKIDNNIQALNNLRIINNFAQGYEGYCAHTLFYQKMLSDKNIHVYIIDCIDVKPNDTVLVNNTTSYDSLNANYQMQELESYNTTKLFAIGNRK